MPGPVKRSKVSPEIKIPYLKPFISYQVSAFSWVCEELACCFCKKCCRPCILVPSSKIFSMAADDAFASFTAYSVRLCVNFDTFSTKFNEKILSIRVYLLADTWEILGSVPVIKANIRAIRFFFPSSGQFPLIISPIAGHHQEQELQGHSCKIGNTPILGVNF